MASKIMSFFFFVLTVSVTYAKPEAKPGVIAATSAAFVAPSTYNFHVVNHAITAPVVVAASPLVSSAYVASPYLGSPYLAEANSVYYGGYAGYAASPYDF